MASSSNSWIPHGRHEVQIGPSLNRALKARKGGAPPPAKRSGPPEKDFYSFRYNFKPPSVDTTKPGTIEVSRGKDASNVNVEHPSSQLGESYVFTGIETPAKEVDCVLIYDEETGSYKLEKLESCIVLTYERKNTISLPPSASPSPAKVDTPEEQLRYSLQDAEGESEDGEMPNHFAVAPQEEEEEEDGQFEVVAPPPPPPVKQAKAPPPPKQRPAPVAAPRPVKPVPQRKPTKKAAPPTQVRAGVDLDAEEDPQIGRPPAKRAKRAPSPVAFSFPGSSNWVPPPAPTPAPHVPKAPPPPALPIAVASDSDEDEDDWDPVEPAAPIAVPAEEEGTQEIDLNDLEVMLEAEMEAEMEDDQDDDASEPEEVDFLADVLPQAPDSAVTPPVRPLSMGQLAGYSEEEYSSSEDSDDD